MCQPVNEECLNIAQITFLYTQTSNTSSRHKAECWGTWDTTCGHTAKDISPSIAWRREAWKEEALDDLPSKDERGPSSIRRIWHRFKSNVGETSEWWGGAHKGFSGSTNTILNWIELNLLSWTCLIMSFPPSRFKRRGQRPSHDQGHWRGGHRGRSCRRPGFWPLDDV